MKINGFKIENYKNIRLAECNDLPSLVVICGGNGCGKSSILQALMTIKEMLGRYGHFPIDKKAVSADSDKALITIDLIFNDEEISYLKKVYPKNSIPEQFSATLQILNDGTTSFIQKSLGNVEPLFSRYTENHSFFDYFSAHRDNYKSQLNTWNADFMNENMMKQVLSQGQKKYQFCKQYLANLKMNELQNLQKSLRDGKETYIDSLKDIREFFNKFFSPMKFDDVYLNTNPFKFSIETPRGKIDIDDLSSGEKEILNTYIHFHQLRPKNSIILFDEPDVHLHPELERKYLKVLKNICEGNQFFITTHSPEMMIEAGNESLFTIVKYQNKRDENQFVKVSEDEKLHSTLSEVMGSKGFVSLNKKIIFIEGEITSTDIQLYEKFYSPEEHNITFIPAGSSSIIKNTSEKVNYLLKCGSSFQEYYCIIDGDIERENFDEEFANLFKLPVYHVENFLLDEDNIYNVTKMTLNSKCKYSNPKDVLAELKGIALDDMHLFPFTKALMDSRVLRLTKKATDLIYQKKYDELKQLEKIEFNDIRNEAEKIINDAIANDEWKAICKGRDLIKGYCKINGLNYEYFRNILISQMEEPPNKLKEIMNKIL